jgi:hypothetical protein
MVSACSAAVHSRNCLSITVLGIRSQLAASGEHVQQPVPLYICGFYTLQHQRVACTLQVYVIAQ